MTVDEKRAELSDRSQVVVVCGSTRFRREVAAANRGLTLAGYIVLAPGVFHHDGDAITEQQKVDLDRLHLAKIDLADWVYVVSPGGYLGESTRREIAYATSLDKPVSYSNHSDHSNGGTADASRSAAHPNGDGASGWFR